MPQFETYFVKETNGYLYIPGAPKLPEFGGTCAYAKAALNTGFDMAALNYKECAFNMYAVSVKDNTYRIVLHFNPEIFIDRVYESTSHIMARKDPEIDKNPEALKAAIFTVIRENGIIRLKVDTGEWVCTNSKGDLYCSDNEAESMHIVPAYTTY